VVRLDTVRTAKIKKLYEITNGLLSEMVKENHIDSVLTLNQKVAKH